MRRMLGALGLVLTGAAATACAPAPFADDACPAIGWINEIEVDAARYGDGRFVQLCTDAGCSPAPGVVRTTETDLAVPHSDGDGFQVGMTAPEKVIIRVYDAPGTLVHDAEHDIRWTHTEGRCGGPSTAERVVL